MSVSGSLKNFIYIDFVMLSSPFLSTAHLVNVVMQLTDRDQEQKRQLWSITIHRASMMVCILRLHFAAVACSIRDWWICKIVLKRGNFLSFSRPNISSSAFVVLVKDSIWCQMQLISFTSLENPRRQISYVNKVYFKIDKF